MVKFSCLVSNKTNVDVQITCPAFSPRLGVNTIFFYSSILAIM